MTDIIDNLESNFKSSLPPRKRAKTKEEKEQRRVERILRNRRAAHASREKKRKHVEYLESYVLKLEDNLAKLQSNYDNVCGQLSAKQLAKIDLQTMDDLQELKDKIHTNLNGSLCANDEAEDNDDESTPQAEQSATKKRKLSNTNSFTSESTETNAGGEDEQEGLDKVNQIPHIKMENADDSNELLSITNENVYYNYLSPISINSPINSPIDLTLKKSSEDLPPLSLTEGTDSDLDSLKVYDSMGQNSEEILLPGGYDH